MLRLAIARSRLKPQKEFGLAILSWYIALPVVFEDLKSLQRSHVVFIETGREGDVFHANKLINAYARFGRLDDALLVFRCTENANIFTWNSVIRWCYHHGHSRIALDYFYHLLGYHETIKLNVCSIRFALRACFDLGSLEDGLFIHRRVFEINCEMQRNVYVGAELIHMYCGLGCIEYACQVFDQMPERNEVVWSLMISGFVHNGCHREATKLFTVMRAEGFLFNSFTMVSLVQSSASLTDLNLGGCVHGCILKTGLDGHAFVGTSLVDMYVKYGCLDDAHRAFEAVSQPNTVTWNAIISGVAHHCMFPQVFCLFKRLQWMDLRPNSVTILSLMSACSGLKSDKLCKCVHSLSIKFGVNACLAVGNALLEMYSGIGFTDDTNEIFNTMQIKDVISWTAMMNMNCRNGSPFRAIQLFHQMINANIEPDMVSMVALLTACSLLGDLHKVKMVHNQIVTRGLEVHNPVRNSLVSVYLKHGDIKSAERVLDMIPEKSSVSWSAMISGYVLNGRAEDAVKLMIAMPIEDRSRTMDSIFLVSGLSSIAELADLEFCKQVHAYTIASGFQQDCTVENALVSAYSKCGLITDARMVFDKMNLRDTIAWNTIISGYGINGDGKGALSLYHEMGRNEVPRDCLTYTNAMNACSHAGLVDEGLNIFNDMAKDARIEPEAEHYACVVDMLARAGRLSEALKFVDHIVAKPSSGLYGALLSGFRIHGNVNLATHVVDMIPKNDLADPGHAVLLSNIYAAAGRFEEVASLRCSMKMKGLVKKPGMSLVQAS